MPGRESPAHLVPLFCRTPGLACYAVGMFALSYWDKSVLPGLQRKGILPYMSSNERDLDENRQRREAEKRAKNLTPITAQHRPLVGELDSKACHYIGTVRGVRQYLCVRKDNAVGEECEFSEEFSAIYKQVSCSKVHITLPVVFVCFCFDTLPRYVFGSARRDMQEG